MKKLFNSFLMVLVLFTSILVFADQAMIDYNFTKDDNIEEIYRKHNQKIQVITSHSDRINPKADLVVFARTEWVQPDGPFTDRCGKYHLPNCVKNGKTITFLNKATQVNILSDEVQYNQFWHITFSNLNDSVTLQWTEKEGWVILSQVQEPKIHSLRKKLTKFVHTICTTRRIPGSIGDFVATVDTDVSSPFYGTIVNISWGSVSTDSDPSVEYHHGGLLDVGKETFLGVGSLRWDSTQVNGGSLLDFHQLVSEKTPNLTATAITTLQDAVHSVRMNPYSNNIIASVLGTSGTSSPSDGPGHFIEIIPNLLFPSTPLVVNNLHTVGEDPNEYGPSTLEGDVGDQDDWLYDFTINFCTQTMVSTSWAGPFSFENGFDPSKPYGRAIRVYSLEKPGTGPSVALLKRFTTNPVPSMAMPGQETGEGLVPLEVRRVHHPEQEKYFVGVTLPGAIDYVYKKGNTWKKKTIVTPNQLVADCKAINSAAGSLIPNGSPLWAAVPGLQIPLVTDITLSPDDRYLYVSCWLAGCIVRYDIRKLLINHNAAVTSNGGIGNLGGILAIDGQMPFNTNTVRLTSDQIPFNGGPQMLRVTPDGQILFVTNSLFSSWDDQFYPAGIGSIRDNGGKMLRINTGVISGVVEQPMELDLDFFVNFKDIEWNDRNGSPATFTSRAHECHLKGDVTHG